MWVIVWYVFVGGGLLFIDNFFYCIVVVLKCYDFIFKNIIYKDNLNKNGLIWSDELSWVVEVL